ncbi:MAG: hypothetical protein ACRD9L_03605, partial [Bryobacteraceae bacterium]
ERLLVKADAAIFAATSTCARQQFGDIDWEGVVAAAAILSGQPWLATGGKFSGATSGTSLISSFLSKVLPQQLPIAVPTITNAGLQYTTVLGRALGRWVPIAGWVLLAYDTLPAANNFIDCVHNGIDHFVQRVVTDQSRNP